MIELSLPLLQSKFQRPALPSLYVNRPRLREILNKAAKKSTVWLWAPAGYGKSVATASWASNLRVPAAWLSADDLDEDPSYFASELLHAIRLLAPECGTIVPETRFASSETFAASLCSRLAQTDGYPREAVLIIDNIHALSEPSARLLELFLRYRPDHLIAVLISRRMPPEPIARYLLSHEHATIEPEALKATEKESDLFWSKADAFSPKEEGQLAALFGGWLGPMALLAQALEDRAEKPTALLGVDPGSAPVSLPTDALAYLDVYLEINVANNLDSSLHELYACCTVLGQFDASLLSAVLEQDGNALERSIPALREAGLITLDAIDGPQHWWRSSTPGTLFLHTLELHPQRSLWLACAYQECEKRGLFDLAVAIAQRNGDWHYIEKTSWHHFSTLVKSNDFELVWDRLSQIPPAQVKSKSRYAVMSVMAAARRRDFAKMDEALTTALSTLKQDRKDQYYALTNIICATARAVSAERSEARRLIEETEGLLDNISPYLKGTAEQIIAESYMESDIILMASKLQKILDKGEWRVDEYFGKSLLSTMTLVNAMLGHAEAQQLLDPLLKSYGAETTDHDRSLFMRYHLGKAIFCYREGHLQEALDHLMQCESEIMLSGIEIDRSIHMGLRALLAFISGERAIASDLFFQALEESPLFLAYIFPSLEFLRAQFPDGAKLPALLYRQRDGQQPAILRLRTAAEHFSGKPITCVDNVHAYALSLPASRPVETFHWTLLAAHLAFERNHLQDAISLSLKALDMAEQHGFIQPFLDDGPFILPILRRSDISLSDFQRHLLQRIPPRETPARNLRQLTPREREVAALLDTSLSYEEMADRLFISIETLRKHVKRIFSKLNVHSRSQAIAQLRNAADVLCFEKTPDFPSAQSQAE